MISERGSPRLAVPLIVSLARVSAVADVALIASSFSPRVGGVEEHVLRVAQALREDGCDAVVWTVDRGDRVPDHVEGVPVRALPCPMPARSIRSLLSFALHAPAAALAWWRALRQDRPAVLHVHCYGPNGAWATALAGLVRHPLIVTTHGETLADDHDAFGASALLRWSLRRSLRRAAQVTACSDFAAADLVARFGLAVGRAQIVPNGVDLEEPAGAPPGGLPTRYLLGVGRLEAMKGFDLLIRGFAAADLPDDVGLVIAGEGSQGERLAEIARERGIAEKVVLPGRLSRGEVVAVMAGATAVIVPSRTEAFGIVVLEGWRASVPVVATNRGGPAALVTDGADGLVVDPEDEAALAGALRLVVTDQVLSSRVGAAGRLRAEEFSWQGVAREYRSLYTGVC